MITALLVALAVSVAVNVGILLYAGYRADKAAREERRNHAACIAHVTEYVGNEFAALVLEHAADYYDSPEGERYLNRLARMKYKAGGPNMPVLFLYERAKEIRAEVVS